MVMAIIGVMVVISLLAMLKALIQAVMFAGLAGFIGWVALMFFPPIGWLFLIVVGLFMW